jgi:hypothetical protein
VIVLCWTINAAWKHDCKNLEIVVELRNWSIMLTTTTIMRDILYINSVSMSVSQSVEVLKPKSLLIKLSPRTRGPKNYSGPRVLTSYFYFYVRFHATTAVVDGGGIFGIWRVGEEIWVRFFWAKGLGGSWFLFFSWRGGGGRGGVLGVLIGGSELEWEMWRTGWGGSTGCIMHRVHTSKW